MSTRSPTYATSAASHSASSTTRSKKRGSGFLTPRLVDEEMTSAERVPYIPEVPIVAETLPGYEATTWYGLLLPVGTPTAVRDKVHAAAMQAVGMPDTRKRLEELGYVTMTDTPQEFARFLREDIEKMARLIKQYNLKPE